MPTPINSRNCKQAWNSWYTQHPEEIWSEPGVSEARRTQKALRTPTVKSWPKKIKGPDNPNSLVHFALGHKMGPFFQEHFALALSICGFRNRTLPPRHFNYSNIIILIKKWIKYIIMIKVKVIAYNKNDYIFDHKPNRRIWRISIYNWNKLLLYNYDSTNIKFMFIQPCHKTKKLNMYLNKKYIIIQNLYSKIRNYLIRIIEQSI